MFKFIHAADIHLDSPLRGLANFDDAPVDQIRTATRRAFENLVDLAIDESVAFVVIAGDLWDGDWPDAGPGLFFVKQASRLREAGIQIYLIRGNHDAQNALTRDLRWPTNVNMFHHRRPQTLMLPEWNVAIHGQSFPEPNVTDDLSSEYPPAIGGAFNIGVLHTCLDGDSRHYSYAPCSIDSLVRKGYDYWALGHVHQRRVVSAGSGGAWIVFPGNLQGRHIQEQGPKGCEVITVDQDGVSMRFEALDVVRWLEESADVSGSRTLDDVDRIVWETLSRLRQIHPGRLLAVRLHLTGQAPVANELGNSEKVRERLTSIAVDLDQIWLERIVAEARSPEKVNALPLSVEIQELINEIATNDETALEWMKEFGKLRGLLGGELADLDCARAVSDPAQFRALVGRAGGLIL